MVHGMVIKPCENIHVGYVYRHTLYIYAILCRYIMQFYAYTALSVEKAGFKVGLR